MHRLFSILRSKQSFSNEDARKISPRVAIILKDWVQKGWIDILPETDSVTEETEIPEMTAEQTAAVETITGQIVRFNVWVLHGVTGSGKTEVYLRLIAKVLAEGKQVLVLIPEISLTPQLESVFRKRFIKTRIVSLHSGLNDTERLTGWLQAQQGEAGVILGTRLAVFTPLAKPGLVNCR